MCRVARAALRPSRSLSPVELDTIRVGLQMIHGARSNTPALWKARMRVLAMEICSDKQLETLSAELLASTEVRVCRQQK